MQALQYTSIFPRTNGYLKRLLVDIGDHVQTDQLLAEIDTPEVDAQLDQARANADQAKMNLVKAQTDLALAKLTLDRYQSVTDKRAVSQQGPGQRARPARSGTGERGRRQGRDRVLRVRGATATGAPELREGHRTFPPGRSRPAISTSGPCSPRSAPAEPRSFSRLRELTRSVSFVNVPQEYAATVQVGQTADVLVRNYPGRRFEGQVTRSAGAVNPTTRTLRFEVDVANPDGQLFAGMYGQVQFHIAQG